MLSVPGENRAPVLAVFLLLVFLMLLSAQIRFPETGARLQSGLLFLVSPVARTAVGVVEGAGDLWTGYVDLHGTWAENHKLKREVERLRLAARRSQATGEENRRLRQLLDLQQALTLRTVAARVILLNLRGPFRVAVLDRGWKDGISRDDAVITPDGVVGRITAVTGRMAKVHLIVDPSSGAAALGERSRVQGMAVGRGVNEVELRYISTLADLKPGDWVDTS
ncbi:MAG: rod shape-determining protein MreC, partial [Acidobacteriota bacterium]